VEPGKGVPARVSGTKAVTSSALGPAFWGVPAVAGLRLLAFLLDAAVVAGVGVGTFVFSESVLLTSIAGVEALFFLGLWEARVGLTVGNALCGIRTAVDDKPWSPGVGREAVRSLVLGVGLLLAVVGALVVVLSGRMDKSERGRTLADRAAGTVVVKTVPRKARPREQVPVVAPALAGHVTSRSSHYVVPRTASTLPGVPAIEEPPGVAPRAVAVPASAATSQLAQSLTGEAPIVVPALVSPLSLLMVFDTGQREQVPEGIAVVVGRAPSPQDEGDRVIRVADTEGTVSKNHVRVEHARDGVWVTDLGSTNGTEILEDDVPPITLGKGVRTHVDESARVRLGHRVFTISRVQGG
jgi:hypothetical protein